MFTVMIAEDELWLRNSLIEMVERLGESFKVVGEATNGEEAWDLIHELWPTILITDVMMPKTDGLELARRIWEHKLPIVTIIVSGYDNFQYAQQAMRYNVFEYLLKPLKEEEMARALHGSLENINKLRVEHAYTLLIQRFFDSLHTQDTQAMSFELSNLLETLLDMTGMRPGVRIGMLRIVAGRLNDMIASERPTHMRDLPPDGGEADIRKYFQMLLDTWMSYVPRFVKGETNQVIQRVCEYVDKNYMMNLSLTGMARQENLSLSYFSMLFKQCTGETFVNYVNRVRIEYAKKLLLEPDMKIYEVAEMVGYGSLHYFSRVFKQWSGISPGEYRKRLGL